MTRFKIGTVLLGLMIGVLAAAPANAWKRGNVEVLAVVPDNARRRPHGRARRQHLRFDVRLQHPGRARGPAVLFVFSPNGNGQPAPIANSTASDRAHARARLQSGQQRPAGHRLWGRKSPQGRPEDRCVHVFMDPMPVPASMR